MLMSKSRLEKFLYALYSLDSSDLPTPLSRIEELYNCWVTGEEAPTFKPLSRVEKYLMAILGVYDADELPNPLSRVEVLLYKLATGDDNLDDVKSFLSEHEELLAEIIRNGGAGGNIDIEYVLYTLSTEFNTLYNTAEKPVKSAILKGNTLVNLAGWNNIKNLDYVLISNNMATINFESYYASTTIKTANMIKQNTTYTLIIDSKVTKSEVDGYSNPPRQNGMVIQFTDGTYQIPMTSFQNVGERVLQKVVFTVENKEIKQVYMRFFTSSLATSGACQGEVYSVMLIEGDYTNTDIPYFEGMQSVKMPVLTTTGKNLLPRKTIYNNISFRGLTVNTENNRVRVSGTATGICDIEFFNINTMSDDEYIKVKPNTKYILSATLHSGSISGNLNLACKSIADDGTIRWLGSTFTTNSNESKVNRIRIAVPLGFVFNDAVISLQLEESTVATSYEPYKSNILTVNEDVELRGIGEVQDELNPITGELTERIGNAILDGTNIKAIKVNVGVGGVHRFDINLSGIKKYNDGWVDASDIIVSDNFIGCIPEGDVFKGANGLALWGSQLVVFFNDTSITTISQANEYLQNNLPAIQYHLATESVKTVDLSVVNQDGNDTKLSTFNDITYVTLSSEGPIPEAELEVATKNEEVLNTMSLEMDDISTTQNALQEISNTQSENVDATMMATTEIYEQIL